MNLKAKRTKLYAYQEFWRALIDVKDKMAAIPFPVTNMFSAKNITQIAIILQE